MGHRASAELPRSFRGASAELPRRFSRSWSGGVMELPRSFRGFSNLPSFPFRGQTISRTRGPSTELPRSFRGFLICLHFPSAELPPSADVGNQCKLEIPELPRSFRGFLIYLHFPSAGKTRKTLGPSAELPRSFRGFSNLPSFPFRGRTISNTLGPSRSFRGASADF
jgi:hypothetical protein